MANIRSPRRIRHWLFLLALAATLPFAILTFIQLAIELREVREAAQQTPLGAPQAIASRLAAERAAARSLLEQSAILVALFATFVALSTFVAQRIERPIVALAQRARHLMLPDAEGVLPEEGPPEIAALARSFNDMLLYRAERERVYRTILETTGDGIWTTDERGKVVFMNTRATEMLGHPAVEVVGTALPDLFSGTTSSAVKALLEGCREGVIIRLDLDIERQEGKSRWLMSASPLFHADGSFAGCVATTTDTTAHHRAEALVRENEMRLHSMFSSAMDGIITANEEQLIVMFNPAAEAMFGIPADEVRGLPLSTLIPERFRGQYAMDVEHFGAANEIQQGMGDPAAVHGLRASGEEFPVEASISHVNVGGRALYSIILRDITQRLASERAARDSQMRLAAERGAQELARARYTELLAAVNETAITLLSHHDVEETLQIIATRAAALTGAAGSFVELGDGDRTGKRVVAAVGICVPYIGREVNPGEGLVGLVHDTRQPVVIDDIQQWTKRFTGDPDLRVAAGVPIFSGGEVRGVLGIAESYLAKSISSEQLELLTRLAQLGSIAIDNAGLIADARREVTERALAEAEVRRLNALLEARVRERTAQLEDEVAERMRAQEALQQRGSELAALNLELAASALMKDEFLANMSHELRTPLNAVLGMAEVLREGIHGPLTANQTRSLQVITESGTHLLELINDVLDLSKVEAGMIELDVQPLSVKAIAASSISMVREAAFRKQLHLTVEIDPGVETVDADARRLKQILVNLLSNAVKFTPASGSVGLTVEGNERSNEVCFAVWDTGIGIAESQIPRLFTPFFQADSGYTRQYAGTGLGLSLVRRFAGLHGGRVDMESVAGEGSRFSVVLPWRHGLVASPPEAATEKPPPHRGDGTLLIIEDNPIAAEQISRYARDLGLQSVLSDGSEDPVELALRVNPSVILLDVLFPTTNGWQMLAALKTSENTSAIPVVMVSVVDDAAQGLTRGAAAYLVKPISREKLESTLVRLQALPLITRTRERLLILIAEDNETNIHLLKSYLDAMKMNVVIARDGSAAITAARESHPDLILMDVQMPVLDGLKAIRILRKEDADIAAIPIIALTALAMTGDKERCLAAGANDYLTKPVSYKALDEAIGRLVRRVESR